MTEERKFEDFMHKYIEKGGKKIEFLQKQRRKRNKMIEDFTARMEAHKAGKKAKDRERKAEITKTKQRIAEMEAKRERLRKRREEELAKKKEQQEERLRQTLENKKEIEQEKFISCVNVLDKQINSIMKSHMKDSTVVLTQSSAK